MKNLFENFFWQTLGLMALVALTDLWFLTTIDFGAGFVLTFIFFVWGMVYREKHNIKTRL
jgi:hypothetical protein